MNSAALDPGPATSLLFPLWQVDRGEYEAICAYLELEPKASIHARLNAYLCAAPFRFVRPRGFSRFLAEPRLTRFRVARLDLATRLIDRGHPLRHVLNAVIALHECDPDGYAQMAASPIGARLLLSLAAWGAGFALNLAITLPWLGLQLVRYAPRALRRGERALDGKRVLVTGVARGLGQDVMLECLQRGAEVIGTVRDAASFRELQRLLPAMAPVRLLVADLATPGALVAALRQVQLEPDSLALTVLCAGVKHDSTSALSTAAVRNTFEVNFFSAADLAHWLFTDGPAGPSSRVAATDAPPRSLVLVSSMGRWHGMHSTAGYNASKAALSIWAESLEMDLRRAGKKHPAIAIVEPGMFESGMARRKGIAGWLFVSRREVAEHIVSGALAGKRTMRPPLWFALLTWAVCIAGRELQFRVFNRAKAGRAEDR